MNIKKGIFAVLVILSLLPFVIGADPKPYVVIMNFDKEEVLRTEEGEDFRLDFIDKDGKPIAYCNRLLNGVGHKIYFIGNYTEDDMGEIAFAVFRDSEHFTNDEELECYVHQTQIVVIYNEASYTFAGDIAEMGLIKSFYIGEVYEYALLKLATSRGQSKFEKVGHVFDVGMATRIFGINNNILFMFIPCGFPVATFVLWGFLRDEGLLKGMFKAGLVAILGGFFAGVLFKVMFVSGLIFFPRSALLIALIVLGIYCLLLAFVAFPRKKETNPMLPNITVVNNPVEQERKHHELHSKERGMR